MHKMLLMIAVLASGAVLAQNADELIDGKTSEQIVQEYRQWSRQKNDWPLLGMFRKDNATLSAPKAGEKRVVFMGDSITQGWSDASPEYFAGKPYVERGISGQTTAQMLVRFRADVLDLQPSVVVILAGTNDLAENTGPASNKMIQDNLASMAELAAAHGIRVVMSSIMPVEDYPWRPGLGPTQRIIDINAWMQDYCRAHGFVYLDYFSALVNEHGGMQERYSFDGVHANKAGYTVMEELAEAAISQVLAMQVAPVAL